MDERMLILDLPPPRVKDVDFCRSLKVLDFCDAVNLQSSLQVICSFSTWSVSSIIVSLLDYLSCYEAVTGNSWDLNILL